MKKIILLLSSALITAAAGFSQGSPDYNGGLKVNFDEEGNKYFRLITWAQIQANYNLDSPEGVSPAAAQVRRARTLMYAQLSDRILIMTHWGLNSLSSNTMNPLGTGSGSQLFMHDAWVQYGIGKNHVVGGGLHYFNGISRLNNQSTLNMLPMDNNRSSWSTLGLTDQFARHVGVFAKGTVGKLQYRVAVNDAMVNTLDSRDPYDINNTNQAVYRGKELLGSEEAGLCYAGYFEYALFDQESNFLPYKVGTYLGAKKILNIGAGFFMHPNGAVIVDSENPTELKGENVSIFAGDIFYEAPVGSKNSAVTAYATYQSNNYGTNYNLGAAYGTGDMIYGQAGYVIPGDLKSTRYQPYVSYMNHSYDASDDSRSSFGLGMNAYLNGHNAKLTLEYRNSAFGDDTLENITFQAQIYL